MPWRFTHLSLAAAGAAAGIVVAIVGVLLLAPRPEGPGITASPAPSIGATTSPGIPASPGPSPTAGVAHLGHWSSAAAMSTPRSGHTATLLDDGRVLVVGGSDSWAERTFLSSAEIYDPNTGTWTQTGSMSTPRADHQAVLLNDGRVFVIGMGKQILQVSAEIWDPATGEWSPVGDWREDRTEHAAALLPDGRVLIASASGVDRGTVFDPLDGTWTPTGRMVIRLSGFGLVVLADGTVLAVGGYTFVKNMEVGVTVIEAFDPTTETWQVVDELPEHTRAQGGILLADGRVLVLDSGTWRALLVDPGFETIEVQRRVIPVWAGSSSSLRLDDRLVFFAGPDGVGVFDPALATWTAADPMLVPRARATFTLLPSGDVLVVGGEVYDQGGGGSTSSALVDLYERPDR